ncbi:MAG: radical SAM protein [Candidatus Pacearchaeota archaeon]
MNIKKVILVDASPRSSRFGVYLRHSLLDPLALEYFGAVARKEGFEVKIIQQRNENKKQIIHKILRERPDVVCFTSMTYNFLHSKEIALEIKKRNPKAITVFGGYHVSAITTPEYGGKMVTKDIYGIDFIVVGEGEETFAELLECLKNNLETKEIKGIAYFKNKHLVINPLRERIRNLDNLPFPLRKRELIFRNKQFTIWPPMSKQRSFLQIQCSRGCPYNCEYCASPMLLGRMQIWRSAKNIVDEIEELHKKFGTNYFKFADLNFMTNKKKVIKICNEILRRKINVFWCIDADVRQIDEGLLKKMKQAGCARITVGIESLSEQVLKDMQRMHTLEDVKKFANLCTQIGIACRGFLMLGHPLEEKYFSSPKEYLNEYIKAIRSLARAGLDELRISFVTPFPGTMLFKKYKRKISTFDWSKYTTDIPILHVKYASPKQLVHIRKSIFKEFYNCREYREHVLYKIRKFPEFKQGYREFFSKLKSIKILS